MPPKKATSQQNKTLVDLVAESDCIRWGKGTPEAKKAAWDGIALQLSALGGVQKNGDGWKKSFTELKSHIKSKIRGGKVLNENEKKCAEVVGLHLSCSGMSEVPELGMGVQRVQTETFTDNEEAILVWQEPEAEPAEIDSEGKLDQEVEAQELEDTLFAKQTNVSEATKTTEKPAQKIGIKKRPIKSTQFKNPKTSVEQYEMYLNYKKLKHKNEEEDFEKLCHQLNSEKNCLNRSAVKWKKIFSKWEKRVKAKARRIYFEQEQTGGGIPIIEVLTNLEKKLLEILSKILIYGHPYIIELGFRNKSENIQPCTFKTKKKIRKKQKNRSRKCIDLHNILYKNDILLKMYLGSIGRSLSNLNKALANLLNALNK